VTDVVSDSPRVYEYARQEVDPVTFEVIRHRLLAITDEQGAALSAVSGSPLVNEATDFNTGLYRANGEVAAMGQTVIFHAASCSQMVRFVLEDCEDDPGIHEDDVFIVNSPYKGALHAPDMGVLAPIFHEGQRIAWAGAACHQLDVGGMVHGSFASKATDVRQEAMLIPPLKLIDRGELRTDVWNTITGMSRLPLNMGLDLKGMLAASNVAKRRLAELIDRYGVDVVLSVMDELMDLSERRLRARLQELPDGEFTTRTYLDHDGHEDNLHAIEVTLTKAGDQLTFDYSCSSPQAKGFVNCTYTGLLAGVYAGVLPILAFDLPWSEGIFRVVDVVAPPGLICSAQWPAPVSQGPLGAMWLTEVTATEVLSKLVSTSHAYLHEAQAAPAGGPDVFNVDGRNQYGEPASGVVLDQTMTGGGAYAHRDGISPQGHRNIIAGKAPNVESLELIMPILYLYRRLLADTPGAGRNRGGQSSGASYMLHDVDAVRVLAACHGYSVPTAFGLWGGLPAGCNVHRLLRETNVRATLEAGHLVTSPEQLEYVEEELSAKPPIFDFGRDDVYEWGPQGGGGWGDPLLRDPAEVAADVRLGAVTARTALLAYGVVVDEHGDVDEAATDARRDETRTRRRTWPADAEMPPIADTGSEALELNPVGDQLSITRSGDASHWTCRCGHRFAPAAENPKRYLGRALAAPEDIGSRIRLHEDIEVRLYACHACGLQHFSEVARKEDAPVFDVRFTALEGEPRR
jgi:N-methylhydantoinase B